MKITRTARGVITVLATVVLLAAGIPAAQAATPPIGVFPTCSATGTGFDAAFPVASGMPVAHVTSTANSAQTVAAGASTFLGASPKPGACANIAQTDPPAWCAAPVCLFPPGHPSPFSTTPAPRSPTCWMPLCSSRSPLTAPSSSPRRSTTTSSTSLCRRELWSTQA